MVISSTLSKKSGQAMLYNFLLNEVLASQLTGEYEFWIVAPWVTNFRLDEPYYVCFQEIVETKQESLYLFDILHQIAANGGRIKIVIGSDRKYYSALQQLCQQSDRISVRVLNSLHTKAYVGRYGGLQGSLNLTHGGVNQNSELYTYYYNDSKLAQLKKICQENFEKGELLKNAI